MPTKKIETLTSPYSSPIGPKYQRVLDYWNGQAVKPSVEFAKDAFFEMANDLALEKCEFHPDVLDALLRSDYDSKTKPFKEHHIPGTIHSVDYDFGNINLAYFDNDYQNVKGPGSGEHWNRGWKYRNDGVDIELSGDSKGAKYSVGWIRDFEWLLYTVSVDQSGRYDINFRVASSNSNGKLLLLLDDRPITNVISITSTGGWKNWQSISTTGVSIPAGSHTLKILFIKGGLNLNYLRFKLDLSSIEGSQLFIPITEDVLVAQNYPNPFNNITQIPIFLHQPKNLILKIYNARGAVVKNLFTGKLPDGLHKIFWDSTNDFSRPVASGLYF